MEPRIGENGGARGALGAVAAGTALGAGAVAGLAGLTLLQVWRGGRPRDPAPADALLVFGARAHPDRPTPELRARLEHAARLFAGGWAPLVVCSGGVVGDIDEPAVMRDTLVELGVPAERIVADRRGVDTRAAIASARAAGLRRVLAVSAAYHTYRIVEEGRRQGLECVRAPVTDTPILRNPRRRRRQYARELAAVWCYRLSPSADEPPVPRLRRDGAFGVGRIALDEPELARALP